MGGGSFAQHHGRNETHLPMQDLSGAVLTQVS